MDLDAAFVEEQTEWLRPLARKLVSDAQGADDLVQETWLRALERPPRDWLTFPRFGRTTMFRVYLNRLKSDQRRRNREERVQALRVATQPHQASVVAELTRRECEVEILKVVHALDKPRRDCILLRYYRELTNSQIAAELDLPVDTVKTRIHRGLIQIRKRLLDKDDGSMLRGLILLADLDTMILPKRPRFSGIHAGSVIVSVAAIVLLLGSLAYLKFGDPQHEPSRLQEKEEAQLSSLPPGSDQNLNPRRVASAGSPAELEAKDKKLELRAAAMALDPSAHPSDPNGRFTVADYIMVRPDMGFAMVYEETAKDKWVRENYQLAVFRIKNRNGLSDIRLVDSLNRPGVRNWVSISVYSKGVIACLSLPGGNFEAYLVEVAEGNLELAQLPTAALIRAAINPETGDPRSVTYAKLIETEGKTQAAIYITDGVVMGIPFQGSQEPVGFPRALQFDRKIDGAERVIGLRAAIFGDKVEAYVEALVAGKRKVFRFETRVEDICDPKSWQMLGPAGSSLLPDSSGSEPSQLSWLWRMKQGR